MANKYVILKSIEYGTVFWTINHEDATTIHDGSVAYEILDYANFSYEAIEKCDKARGGSNG